MRKISFLQINQRRQRLLASALLAFSGLAMLETQAHGQVVQSFPVEGFQGGLSDRPEPQTDSPSGTPSGLPIRTQIEQELNPGEVILEPGQRVPPPHIVHEPAALGHQAPMSSQATLPADCCMGCDPGWFATAEALWLIREGDDFFSLSRSTGMSGFDYELGGRFFVGQRWDCTEGWEVGFTGPFDWDMIGGGPVVNAVPHSGLVAAGGILDASLDRFNNSINHSQTYAARLQNWEINRKSFAWDAINLLYGIRMIDYEEAYAFDSIGAAGGTGELRANVDNFLVGAHLGGDWYYPISQRLSIGSKLRAGVFANFNDGNAFVSNNNTLVLNNFDEDVDLAGLFEYGFTAKYRLLPSVALTGGYEFWYTAGIATIPGQNLAVISPTTGSSVDAGEDLFLHGGTAGIEILY